MRSDSERDIKKNEKRRDLPRRARAEGEALPRRGEDGARRCRNGGGGVMGVFEEGDSPLVVF